MIDQDCFDGRRAEMDALFERLNISLSYINSEVQNDSVLSFSYRAARGEYCIYIKENIDSQTYTVCDLREKGRILYNHFTRPQAQKKQFDTFFRENMPVIFFRLPEDKNINQRMGLYSTYIYERFAGISQAMEVNSKLFKDDWAEVRILLEKNTMTSARKQEYLSYPQKDWPQGLDWMTYMLLLCGDMRRALDQIGSGDGNKIKTSDISAYSSEIRDEKRIKETHETRKTIVDGCGADDDERVRRGRTTQITGGAALHSVNECDNFDQFINILRERGMVDKRRRIFTDMLYNVNRNKFNSDIFIPRRRRVIDKTPAVVCILLDVSGSVPVVFLKRIVHTIIQAEGFFDKEKSRLVCWSDSLCSDTPLNELLKLTAGGGTILASGIEYCKKYLDEDSAFFIVSDFQDDIGDWIMAAKNIRARKTAVGYAGPGPRVNLSEWFLRAGSNANSHTTEITLKEFSAVFDMVLLTPPC
ncbi:MAG: VWA domain-containing protein [Spirochaetaceae bacterium]|nr:VWA domain-containing protein [Spirochaetaceae bacterium]